ncbi:hypothetical protein BDD12DRAFT_862660 [Trichophaea hybrida]|nr:hypothetical protein BDD12DRAFT_862660 [Trichophaea hybrida]
MMATEVRDIHGRTFDLADEQTVTEALQNDGILVICSRSTINVPMNSLNQVEAREKWGDLGYTTDEFVKRDIFLPKDVGRALFLLHDTYTLGTSKILIPVPRHKDSLLRPYRAFTATLLGGPRDANTELYLSIETTAGDLKNLTLHGGDILVCTDTVKRTIPQTLDSTVFVSETYYCRQEIVSLEEKLANQYMAEAGGELYRDNLGNVIWSKERFLNRQ